MVANGKFEDAKKELSYALELYPENTDVGKIGERYVRYFKETQVLVEEL